MTLAKDALAVALGRKGGSVKSEAKRKAARRRWLTRSAAFKKAMMSKVPKAS